MTAKLPTWQHVDCPTPNGSADLGCSRYAIMADSASVLAGDLQALTRGTAVEFTLTCTGCGHERQAQVWLRANPRGKRARPARSVTEITVED